MLVQLNWLSVDFNNWKDWEDDSDEDMSNFDRFSEVGNEKFLEFWELPGMNLRFFFFFLHHHFLIPAWGQLIG